jgi:hypothetical protein
VSSNGNPEQPRKRVALDREVEEFRGIMEVPSTFDEGFTWPSFIGAVFVAMVMVPGALYMTLVAGRAIGPAARWVTVILFIEVARRANKTLKRAEIFTLFYLAAAAMIGTSAVIPEGSLLWKQFYAQSTAAEAHGIAEQIPTWFVPLNAPGGEDILAQRSIFNWAWLPAIGLIVFATIMSRLNNTILGYGLFRLASDIEQLPFPLAPLGAQGVLALSEEQEEEDPEREEVSKDQSRWRWRVFSIGSVIGIVFGTIYIGLPTITGALLDKPIVLLPIPFVDWTGRTGQYLPAVATGLSLDLTHLVMGMVLPFWSMVGSFIGLLITFVANPLLREADVLTSWSIGDDTVRTLFKNRIDFYFSFQIGIALAIALTGIISVFKVVGKLRRHRADDTTDGVAVPAGRGDIKTRFIIATYVISTLLYIGVSSWLLYLTDGQVHTGVLIVMVIYGFLYTPLVSYATARLEGIAGQVVNIPFVREASFILSGYQGVAVWFLPLPLHNYGVKTVAYRQAELTGTKFTSIWKSELVLAPIIVLSSILFANFIWGLAPVPGPQYPFAQKMWELYAENRAIIHTATVGGYSLFEKALNIWYILAGVGLGAGMFAGLAKMGAPTFLLYGVVRGLGQTLPHAVVPNFIGALLGRYYFRRRLGLKWRSYVPVVAVGYTCGVGLVGTFSVGVTFLMKSVFQLPF